MYARFFKRALDFFLSLVALIGLSPFLLVLIIVGSIIMKGNPFFTQLRPGKDERIFRLIKFRTMTNATDKNGKLLPDEKRLTGYGKFLRATSLDELPELINILKGDMSIVGPRPLLVEYVPYFTDKERCHHSVRPGLTGLAQVNGGNFVSWDRRLAFDIEYVENISFAQDIRIICRTALNIIKKQDVAVDTNKVEPNFAEERRLKLQEN
jgi:lipopolysaccharide/colanic/teichoic acid biosynthesis glycosyltransferase